MMIIEDLPPEEKPETASREGAGAVAAVESPRLFPFKNPAFLHKNILNGKRKPWKTLKQILAQVDT
jgi:hypothetical protein